MADVEMPQLGETVTEGTITRWFKQVGDSVAEDEPLFEVSTDKVDSEVPSPVSGTITEILVQEGDTVDVGTKLAVIGDAGDAPQAPPADEPAEQQAQPAPEPAPEDQRLTAPMKIIAKSDMPRMTTYRVVSPQREPERVHFGQGE